MFVNENDRRVHLQEGKRLAEDNVQQSCQVLPFGNGKVDGTQGGQALRLGGDLGFLGLQLGDIPHNGEQPGHPVTRLAQGCHLPFTENAAAGFGQVFTFEGERLVIFEHGL